MSENKDVAKTNDPELDDLLDSELVYFCQISSWSYYTTANLRGLKNVNN